MRKLKPKLVDRQSERVARLHSVDHVVGALKVQVHQQAATRATLRAYTIK